MSSLLDVEPCGRTFDMFPFGVSVSAVAGNVADFIVALALFGWVIWPSRKLAYLSFGVLVNVGLNLLLKDVLAQPRPITSCLGGPGMPSGDAQAMAFVAVAVSMLCKREARAHWRWLLALFVFLEALSRVLLGVHTTAQVLVGALIGAAYGGVWSCFGRRFLPLRLGKSVWSEPTSSSPRLIV